MSDSRFYPGYWPSNVAKAAKYTVRPDKKGWKVTVLFEEGEFGHKARHHGADALIAAVNQVKETNGDGPGGTFYVNEFRHVIVPVKFRQGGDEFTACYLAGRLVGDFTFAYEKGKVTAHALGADGKPLKPGDPWRGPRPGVAYILAAGGKDIKYECQAYDHSTNKIMPDAVRKVLLSKVNASAVESATRPIRAIKGYSGGRFYVNETGAMFAPVREDDGLNYIYCGQLDRERWFPEPKVDCPILEIR